METFNSAFVSFWIATSCFNGNPRNWIAISWYSRIAASQLSFDGISFGNIEHPDIQKRNINIPANLP
jgi:hypothetical protein